MGLGPKTTELLGVLTRVAELLQTAGEGHWAGWVSAAADRIGRGDAGGLDSLLGAYGEMGSFNDLHLCQLNGHDVAPSREAAVNADLSKLRSTAWSLASDIRRLAEVE